MKIGIVGSGFRRSYGRLSEPLSQTDLFKKSNLHLRAGQFRSSGH